MKVRVCPIVPISFALASLAAYVCADTAAKNAPLRIPLQAEKLTAPTGVALPMFDTLELDRRGDGRYDIRLAPGENAPSIAAFDLRLMVPRVPLLARDNPALTRLALIQREFNRNEVHNDLTGGLDLSIANNCLEQGLWEVKLARTEGGQTATLFHAWFTFPKSEYARLFEEANKLPYGNYDSAFAAYPGVGGFVLPLDQLRTVRSERDLPGLDRHAADATERLPEQQRKTKLLQTPGISTYGDFSRASQQPITTAKFNSPGVYDEKDSMRFDLTWLAKPSRVVWREVVHGTSSFPEVEAVFSNGYRILLADSRLSSLPARTEPPKTEADVLKLVCGIGTPTIHASATERTAEIAEDRPRYLMLLDAQGNHIDNHLTGVDGVYAWREAGSPGLLHLWLVGYERIALVAHLSALWPEAGTGRASASR